MESAVTPLTFNQLISAAEHVAEGLDAFAFHHVLTVNYQNGYGTDAVASREILGALERTPLSQLILCYLTSIQRSMYCQMSQTSMG